MTGFDHTVRHGPRVLLLGLALLMSACSSVRPWQNLPAKLLDNRTEAQQPLPASSDN